MSEMCFSSVFVAETYFKKFNTVSNNFTETSSFTKMVALS